MDASDSRENLAPSAPYLWKGLGGPKVHQEFWALNGYRKENGVLKSAGDVFDIDEECDLRDLLNPIARQFNFEVQVLDGRFFLALQKSMAGSDYSVACSGRQTGSTAGWSRSR